MSQNPDPNAPRPAGAPRPAAAPRTASGPVAAPGVRPAAQPVPQAQPAQPVPQAPPAQPAQAAPQGQPQAAAATVLDSIPIFQPLPPQLKQHLQAHLTPHTLAQGEILFQAGDVGDAMYIIARGAVSVFLADKTLGVTYELAKLTPGMAFGEMALVTGEARSASVRALEPTQLYVLHRDIFYKLVNAAPMIGITIAGVLAKRLDAHNKSQGIEFGSLRDTAPDPGLFEMVPIALCKRHKMLPLKAVNGVVTVATPDPGNRLGLDDVRRMLRGNEVKLMAVSSADWDQFGVQLLAAAERRAAGVVAKPASFAGLAKQVRFLGAGSDRVDEARLKQVASGQDVVDLLNLVVVEGIERGASDIHIEPDRNQLMVRFRVDGRLQFRDGAVPIAVHQPLMSRLKVLASLDIAERRLPQDGRISLEVGQRAYDLRMATVVTKYGEKATLRILDSSSLEQNIGALILAEKVALIVRKLFYQPHGLVLVTGPTGSGKTTTLYAALKERLNPELSICTIEDPIEYDLPGVTQVQVNESIGLGFAEIMRTFLRQDPDVVLVGETRDATTAKLACNAALTGHLVLSSFHTNDTVAAINRMREMKVEPFVLSEALLGVLNQRLLRRVCPSCRIESTYSQTIIDNLAKAGVPLEAGSKLYKGAGCASCNGEGFKGRVGAYELLVSNSAVHDAIAREASAAEIRAAAEQGSYVSMARYASFLLAQGVTVPSEVLRVLHRE